MHLLVLGYSSLAERRIIPAAEQLGSIAKISVASKSRKVSGTNCAKGGDFYSDYARALEESDANIVYISLPNALHREWVHAALELGKHVIVDKPALMTLKESDAAVAAARRSKRLLAEATVFSFHPHFPALLGFMAETEPLTHIHAQFIIPSLPLSNFRNHRHLGGGCLLDMGPYAAALVRLFGRRVPQQMFVIPGGYHPDTGVDLGFSLITRFAEGASMTGQFSFEGEYQNRLIAVSRSGSVMVDRVFSPPADHKIVWKRRHRNVADERIFPPADCFGSFLDAVMRTISEGDYEPFYRDLLTDAEIRSRIADQLGGST